MTCSIWTPLNPKGCLRRRNCYWVLLSILVIGSLIWFVYVLQHPIRFLGTLGILAILTGLILVVSHLAERQSNFLNTVKLLNEINKVIQSDLEYVLFLRSFSSKLKIENTYILGEEMIPERKIIRGEVIDTGRMIRTFERTGYQTDDVLHTLVRFLPNAAAVIISGAPQELSCAPFTVLSSDDNWRHIYETLARGAKKILILPEPSPSLQLEIGKALSEYRNKLAFIMPPTRSADLGEQSELGSLVGGTRCKRWNDVCELLQLSLPEYRNEGAVLIPDKTANIFEKLPFNAITFQSFLQNSHSSTWTIRYAFQELIHQGVANTMLNEIQRLTQKLPRDVLNR